MSFEKESHLEAEKFPFDESFFIMCVKSCTVRPSTCIKKTNPFWFALPIIGLDLRWLYLKTYIYKCIIDFKTSFLLSEAPSLCLIKRPSLWSCESRWVLVCLSTDFRIFAPLLPLRCPSASNPPRLNYSQTAAVEFRISFPPCLMSRELKMRVSEYFTIEIYHMGFWNRKWGATCVPWVLLYTLNHIIIDPKFGTMMAKL